MLHRIYKEFLSPSSKIINKRKFPLMIYSPVINFMFGAKYKEFIYDMVDTLDKIFRMKDESICMINFE